MHWIIFLYISFCYFISQLLLFLLFTQQFQIMSNVHISRRFRSFNKIMKRLRVSFTSSHFSREVEFSLYLIWKMTESEMECRAGKQWMLHSYFTLLSSLIYKHEEFNITNKHKEWSICVLYFIHVLNFRGI